MRCPHVRLCDGLAVSKREADSARIAAPFWRVAFVHYNDDEGDEAGFRPIPATGPAPARPKWRGGPRAPAMAAFEASKY